MADRTRLIFDDNYREATLRVVNKNSYPVMVQVWVNDGSINSNPSEIIYPLLPIPSVFKLSPKEIKTIRIIKTSDNIPNDRESLFWLNFYETPPIKKQDINSVARMSISMLTQIKIIFRPKKVKDNINYYKDLIKIQFIENLPHNEVIIFNSSKNIVSFTRISHKKDEKILHPGGVILPLQELKINTENLKEISEDSEFNLYAIDDNGNEKPISLKINMY